MFYNLQIDLSGKAMPKASGGERQGEPDLMVNSCCFIYTRSLLIVYNLVKNTRCSGKNTCQNNNVSIAAPLKLVDFPYRVNSCGVRSTDLLDHSQLFLKVPHAQHGCLVAMCMGLQISHCIVIVTEKEILASFLLRLPCVGERAWALIKGLRPHATGPLWILAKAMWQVRDYPGLNAPVESQVWRDPERREGERRGEKPTKPISY